MDLNDGSSSSSSSIIAIQVFIFLADCAQPI